MRQVLTALVLCYLTTLGSSTSSGQITIDADKKTGMLRVFKVDRVDAEAVFEQLCKAFDKGVVAHFHGPITVDFRNVTFDLAMENVARQIGGNWDEINGTIRVDLVNEEEITVPRIRKNLKFNRVDVNAALAEIAKAYGVKFEIAPGLKHEVWFWGNNISLLGALRQTVGEGGVGWIQEGDHYRITGSNSQHEPMKMMLDPEGRSFESAARDMALRLGLKCRMEDGKCFLLDKNDVVSAIVEPKKG